MKIVIARGRTAFYATAEECGLPNEATYDQPDTSMYRGLLVVGDSVDDVLDKLSEVCKSLREARKDEKPKNQSGDNH